MTSPDSIVFVGNINILEEKVDRTEKEKELDDIPEDLIVYPDLVFTLGEDSKKCYRPWVIEHDGKLVVISNPLFFRAAREAGIKKINFDFIPENLNAGEGMIEKYQLEYISPSKSTKYKKRFLFFYQEPRKIDLSGLEVMDSAFNNSRKYQKAYCLQYIFPALGKDDIGVVKRAVESNGKLRSVDGIKNRVFQEYLR